MTCPLVKVTCLSVFDILDREALFYGFNGLLATISLQLMWLDFQKNGIENVVIGLFLLFFWCGLRRITIFLLVMPSPFIFSQQRLPSTYYMLGCWLLLPKKCCLSQDLCLEKRSKLPFPREMSHHILCILAKKQV